MQRRKNERRASDPACSPQEISNFEREREKKGDIAQKTDSDEGGRGVVIVVYIARRDLRF